MFSSRDQCGFETKLNGLVLMHTSICVNDVMQSLNVALSNSWTGFSLCRTQLHG